MRWLGVLGLFLANVCWRVTRAHVFGRVLVRALQSCDENTRLIAGMLLVRGAGLAAPLLREAIETPFPLLLRVIADAGVTDLEPRLASLVHDPDLEMSRAAQDAVETLGRRPRE